MPVYVNALVNWGWKMRGKQVESCHLFTDNADIEELHAFAARLGMKREWFQPDAIAPHYDLVKSRRDLAVQLGAKQVNRREASSIWKARRVLLTQAISTPTGYISK